MKFVLSTLIFFCSISSFGADKELDATLISKLTGLQGAMDAKESVYKVTFPRGDINPEASGVRLTPPMGLTSWAAFTKIGSHVMMMGDTVLTEDQVNPVMSVALENGLEVTALHNHFFGDAPKVMFMHIGGMGSEEQLAKAVGQVYAKVKETMAKKIPFPFAKVDTGKSSISSEPLDAIFGRKGDLKNGIYKLTVGRTTKMHEASMGNAMGVNTWAAFAGTSEKAIVDGDFAMLETELQTVLKVLRKENINIVAIHNHMTMENPRIIFLHFWGIGKPTELAKGIKAALDTQKLE